MNDHNHGNYLNRRNYLKNEIKYVPYMDCSMASQNMLLMAHALGLGAVIVKTTGWEIYSAKSAKYLNMIKKMFMSLNLPDYFIPVSIIALGFPERIPNTPPRLPYENVVHYNKYSEVGKPELFVRHNSEIKQYENLESSKHNIFKYTAFRIVRKLFKYIGINLAINE